MTTLQPVIIRSATYSTIWLVWKKKMCPDQLFGKQRIQNTNYITTSVAGFSVRGLAFGDNDIPAGTLVLKQGSRMASEQNMHV